MITTLRVDAGPIPGRASADGAANEVAVDVHLPERPADRPVLLACLPGGGVTRRYFDLDGGPGMDFSFARAMTAAGHVVCAMDPVGVGDSTRPEDGFDLTVEVQARLMHRALEIVRRSVVHGVDLAALPCVGVGHSAGAMLTGARQAAFRDCSALILFGFGARGLPQYLTPEHQAALAEPDGGRSRLVEFARAMFGGESYFDGPVRETDNPAGHALRAVGARTLATVAIQAMTPGNIAPELAAIDVPVFLAVGDRDMTGPPFLLGADYVACPDFTLHVVPDAGHHVFVAPAARRLYARIANWIEGLDRPDA
jgi:pimeloyl-ACP methyl ester carboxylesterase